MFRIGLKSALLASVAALGLYASSDAVAQQPTSPASLAPATAGAPGALSAEVLAQLQSAAGNPAQLLIAIQSALQANPGLAAAIASAATRVAPAFAAQIAASVTAAVPQAAAQIAAAVTEAAPQAAAQIAASVTAAAPQAAAQIAASVTAAAPEAAAAIASSVVEAAPKSAGIVAAAVMATLSAGAPAGAGGQTSQDAIIAAIAEATGQSVADIGTAADAAQSEVPDIVDKAMMTVALAEAAASNLSFETASGPADNAPPPAPVALPPSAPPRPAVVVEAPEPENPSQDNASPS